MVFAVVRVRGTVNVKPDIKQTLALLQLTRVNHCVLVDESKVYKGMLQKVKDYTTWGEIDQETLKDLIGTRGRLQGDKPLSDEYLKSSTSFESVEKLSKAILEKQFHYKEIPEIKPLFRLNPPKKGHRSIKRSFGKKGALGYRGKSINQLIQSMI
jgi:large subunit ribosomal protein L30